MALAPLLPLAKSLGGTALKLGSSYLASELPTLAKYLGKATLLNGKLTPGQVLDAIRNKVQTKEGREELISGGQKATKVLGKIGNQGLSLANKLGLGGSLTRRLQSSLANKTNSIHEALGNINKINESYF